MYKRTLEFAVGLAGAACNLIPLISIFMALSSGTQIDSPFMVEGVTIPAEVLTPVTIAILSLSTIIGLAGAFMVAGRVDRKALLPGILLILSGIIGMLTLEYTNILTIAAGLIAIFRRPSDDYS